MERKRHRLEWMHSLEAVYTKRQHQTRVNAAMTLATWFSLKKMDSLQNGLQPHSRETLFVSIDFNKSHVASLIAAFTLTLSVYGPLSSCVSWWIATKIINSFRFHANIIAALQEFMSAFKMCESSLIFGLGPVSVNVLYQYIYLYQNQVSGTLKTRILLYHLLLNTNSKNLTVIPIQNW